MGMQVIHDNRPDFNFMFMFENYIFLYQIFTALACSKPILLAFSAVSILNPNNRFVVTDLLRPCVHWSWLAESPQRGSAWTRSGQQCRKCCRLEGETTSEDQLKSSYYLQMCMHRWRKSTWKRKHILKSLFLTITNPMKRPKPTMNVSPHEHYVHQIASYSLFPYVFEFHWDYILVSHTEALADISNHYDEYRHCKFIWSQSNMRLGSLSAHFIKNINILSEEI